MSNNEVPMSFQMACGPTTTVTVDQVLDLFAENDKFAQNVARIEIATHRVVMGGQREDSRDDLLYRLLVDAMVHIKYKCDTSNMILEELTMQGGEFNNLLFTLTKCVANHLMIGEYIKPKALSQQQDQQLYIWTARSKRATGWMSMTKEKRHQKLLEICKTAPPNTTSVLLQVQLAHLLSLARCDELNIIVSRACHSGDDALDGWLSQYRGEEQQQQRGSLFDYALADSALEDGGTLFRNKVYCPNHKNGDEEHASMALFKKWTTAYDRDDQKMNSNLEYITECLSRGYKRQTVEVSDNFTMVSIPPVDASPRATNDEDSGGTSPTAPSNMTDQDEKVEALFAKSNTFSSASFKSKLPDTYVQVVRKSTGAIFNNLVYSVAAGRLLLLYKLNGHCWSCNFNETFDRKGLANLKSVLQSKATIPVRRMK